ncbi:hypothetical protein [Sulfurospirillum sp. 1612]|uniref:hypothetical protein n=1 Tax=Sulfurospirillum sp. 1612 TaxID=3094835 RepID=UPI002F93074D
MTKQECINFLERTQRSYNTHMSTMKYNEAKNFSGYTPVILNKEKSLVGKWIYENIEATKNITGTIFYDELESLHSQWCEEYNKISNVYLKNAKKSFLFGKKIDSMSKDKVKAYLDDLIHTTEQITIMFNKILTRVHALPESKFV